MRLSRSEPHFRARIHSRVCSAHRTSRANVQHTSRRVVSHRAQVELRDDGHAHVRTERASRRRCPKNEDFLKQGDARVRSRPSSDADPPRTTREGSPPRSSRAPPPRRPRPPRPAPAPPRITRILPGRGGIKFATARSPSPRPPRSRSPSPDPPPPSARTRAPSRPASASSPSAKKSSRDASPTRSATNPSSASKDASANPTKQTAKSSAGISTPPKPSRPSTRARCPKRTA